MITLTALGMTWYTIPVRLYLGRSNWARFVCINGIKRTRVFGRHAFLLRGVGFYINNITNAVGDEVGGRLNGGMLFVSKVNMVLGKMIEEDVPLKPHLNMWCVHAREPNECGMLNAVLQSPSLVVAW